MPSSRLFRFLSSFPQRALTGRLEAIFVASGAGQSMRLASEIEAITDIGLANDRYALGSGHWRATDGCQVTLVSSEAIARAERKAKLDLPPGWHRRNLVVSGIDLDAVRRHIVCIGSARFTFHRLRPPCGYLDRITGTGAARTLRQAGGVGLRVQQGGTISVGDPVELVEPD